MLDEGLPTYILKGARQQRHFHVTQYGNDPQPAYALRGADPASTLPNHKNCYAAALFDAYNQDVLYGEVLARPAWTHPTLSADEIRRNGGIPPPPQPILPNEFTVQLYNPDQQIQVRIHSSKWGVGSDTYEFAVPQSTFRIPSASNLDRGQSDPASLAITPKINFVWKKESLSKDFTCFATGKSTDAHIKRSKRDPDIPVALWRSLRELTLYDTNANRLEMEDPKGLEIVLLLSAVVIKDLYSGSKEHMKEIFNISDPSMERKTPGGMLTSLTPHLSSSQWAVQNPRHEAPSPLQTDSAATSSSRPLPPMADPLSQWELDAETARLKAQAEAEAAEVRRQQLARERADEAERRRLQHLLEQEEDDNARRRREEIDRETERLRQKYGVDPAPDSPVDSRRSDRLRRDSSLVRPSVGSNGLVNASSSTNSLMMSGGNGSGVSGPSAGSSNLHLPKPSKKKSFFGLRSASDEGPEQSRRLSKHGTFDR